MTAIECVTLETPDPGAAEAFYAAAFDLGDAVRIRHSDAPSTGFRGFTLSLVVSQPGTVDNLVRSAVQAGATELKPAKKSFWGYGGAVLAPDGTIWTVASSSKKDTGPASREVDDIVLLLGVDDVKASRQFYVDRGLSVAKSFGGKYVEFEAGDSALKLSLNPRHAAAKNAGTTPEGTGSHRLVVNGDVGPFTDPDGYTWQPVRTMEEL
jgi:uncharacterized glyoxalase superfamily protein PhnB